VVDDDEEIANYITSELGEWYKFSYAANGREALKLLLTKSFDLVISDVMMPEMDGITLLRSIKSNPNISHIPVILLTSQSEVQYRLEGLKKGADAYLAKPFSMEELHVLINNLVGNVRRLRGKFTGAQSQENRVEQVKVKGNNDALMDRIMKSVNANMSNPDFDVEMLTQDVGISRAQLHRKMKEITGIPTSEFIRNLRLEQAARLIREKKVNITQVAYSVGFNNQTHFSTVFKKHFGMTPTEYAEQEQ
jgi:YesN/AraC family two-component response regulator